MDKLPIFLVKSIESACDLFSNITYSVHGDENRVRISIMFDRNDSMQQKRKSKSTVARDTKRMNVYVQKKEMIKK